MEAVFEACRWINQYLGIVGCVCVAWRLVPLLLDKERWFDPVPRHRILVFFVLAGFEILAAIAAGTYANTDDAYWFSAGFTMLHSATICLCVWWPHPTRLPR